MIKWLDRFLRKQGFRTKSYYEDCERIGIQRGVAQERFLEFVDLTKQIINGDNSTETKERLNKALTEYNSQEDICKHVLNIVDDKLKEMPIIDVEDMYCTMENK